MRCAKVCNTFFVHKKRLRWLVGERSCFSSPPDSFLSKREGGTSNKKSDEPFFPELLMMDVETKIRVSLLFSKTFFQA